MANLLLTEHCVRSCPYCFAKKQMKENSGEGLLSWADFMYAADFFQLGGQEHLSLLGGEPTLHPEFLEYVLYLYERGFHISVFTSGIVGDKLLAAISAAFAKRKKLEKQLVFVCNVNHPSISPEKELRRQTRFLEVLGKYCTLSFNIYCPDFDPRFLVEYIERYATKKDVRLGLAHPIAGMNNIFIRSDEMKAVAARLLAHYQVFMDSGIRIGLDCGFPLCIFDDAGLGQVYKLSDAPIRFSCGGAIDIGTNLDVWPCFPLSGYEKRSLYDFSSVEELEKFYRDVTEKIRETRKGIFESCTDCVHRKNGLCAGGCAAYVLRDGESNA